MRKGYVVSIILSANLIVLYKEEIMDVLPFGILPEEQIELISGNSIISRIYSVLFFCQAVHLNANTYRNLLIILFISSISLCCDLMMLSASFLTSGSLMSAFLLVIIAEEW
ncbi:hypothetical protein SAMN05421856_102393 [Chryseobacterium taichungense]|uniref:Uncharacterized protein n=1 Tax=Chryseobacterium taichungense TaxID=295069 RepID=A0A1H7XEG5_9FLAO|nr:hypothetical protein SAMN05421856_102393 [Chryseobacterium taichungense]